MPARIRIPLIFKEPIKKESLTFDKLHALFFSLFKKEFSEILHKNEKVKPFSLNFLVLNEENSKLENLLNTNAEKIEKVFIEVNIIDDSLIPKFIYSYVFSEKFELSLDGYKLRKGYLNFKSIISYEKIYETSEISEKICVNFITPTSFKSGNKVNLLPEPKLIFKGLIRKWQKFSELKINIDLRKVIEEEVVISGYELKTEKVETNSMGWFTGFVGKVYLDFLSKDEEVLKWLNALINFGEFCGVGRKTTMGFGKIRVFEKI